MSGDWDVLVIGGGTAGLGASRAAVRGGARTVMVQAGPIGGDCTFTGCVPSKTLIESAAQGADFDTAMGRVRAAVQQIAATEDDAVLTGEGVEVRHGHAVFLGPRTVAVDGIRMQADRVVIATGGGPAVPAIPGLADVPFLTSDTVWQLRSAPASLAVLGGGPVGCELSQAMSRLGVAVTLIQTGPRLLPREEPEASAVILEVLQREGVDVRLDTSVTSVATTGQGTVGVQLSSGGRPEVEQVLVATGRVPGTEGLGLDAAGVRTNERGFVVTDDHLATSADGVYAAGDVTGRMQFTHAADAMGRLAAANATSRSRGRKFSTDAVPWVTFTSPEVARVGITEAQAVEHDGQVAYLPMNEFDRAIAAGRTDGFVKLIAGPRSVTRGLAGGVILGATIVAERGGEMIHEPALAMHTKMFAGRLAEAVHAYPTWSMAVQQAAAQFFIEIGGRRARPAQL